MRNGKSIVYGSPARLELGGNDIIARLVEQKTLAEDIVVRRLNAELHFFSGDPPAMKTRPYRAP